MSTAIPPLKGDAQGRYRIRVVGNSGTGKTTMLRRLESLLGIPALPMDLVLFEPNFVQVPREVFRARVLEFMDKHEQWVVDGNANSVLGHSSTDNATDVIWLDPPFVLYFPRLFWRTMRRIFGYDEPCAPGCDETWRSVFFNKESILLWAITQHKRNRTRYTAAYNTDPVERGGKWRRLGGWGSEAKRWFEEVEKLAKSK
ncbi:hypothetical protein EXIGLDRAFT_666287 [Exidia glandulosa HHB12029]|uniref:P-loop containing nucleoside triphosphate hydrolase protein n=1 Tax=Exidia glandulosa HHB12029 TaxID=1314781 RepID=A0A165P2N4_EXIGL|nr:hypothetical protein EXIGLDRAFT_666287 [Exidia glandulosa HHB12029]